MALDTTQYAAVRHFNGPAMILAGPGSGKTTVITHRVWSLVKDRGVDEDRILVITFTKMAAVEMKNRYLKMGNLHSTHVNFGTFHAIFFMILKDVYGFSAADIVKVSQQWKFVKTQFSLYNVDVRDENDTIGDILSEIAKVKSLSKSERDSYTPKCCDERLFYSIYNEYQRWMKNSHMVDFEDMMTQTYELFVKDPVQLSRWQERFQYILVDEFQDASPMQFEVIKMLAGSRRNVFIVGDDDQSIYGFRGAAPAVMQDFKKSFPDTAVYMLNVNYRSNAAVVEAATRLINKNKDRFFKNLTAFHDKGCDVERLEFETMHEENAYIAELLKDDLTTAILTRTNSSAADIKRFLEHAGIAAGIKSGGDRLFSHWIALDVAAYIKIAMGSRERAQYVRIINKPVRYISRQFFVDSDVDIDFIMRRMRQGGQTQLADKMAEFRQQLSVISKMTPFAGINYIRKGIGYDAYINEYAKEQNTQSGTFMEILDRLQESARDYATYEKWLELYENSAQKDDGKLNVNEIAKNAENNSGFNKVTICTMHSSKGLEYDRVIIIDANEGITPYNKAVSPEDIEEERRLFYVAMTRAKERLVICSVRKRYNKPLLPSRFLREF